MKRLTPAVVIVLGLAASLVLTLLTFQLPLAESLQLLWQGAFGDKFGVARSLVNATPLILMGVGIVLAWRAGMFNIGGEGQYVAGGLFAATLFKFAPHLPPGLLSILLLIAGGIGGAIYAWLAGWLFIKRGIPIVISTILLNFVAVQLLDWACAGPLQHASKQLPQTDALPDAAMLQRFDRQTDLHSGIFLAIAVAIIAAIVLYRTKGGFQLRLVGENPRVAQANGMHPERLQVRAMMLSGLLCGLAGSVQFTGVIGRLDKGFAQGWGFLAIPVALLAGLHPLAVLLSGLYFGALFAGSTNLSRFSQSGDTLIYVIQAIAVLAYLGFQASNQRKLIRDESA